MRISRAKLAEHCIILQIATFFLYLLLNIYQIGFGPASPMILVFSLTIFVIFVVLNLTNINFTIGIPLIITIFYILWIFCKLIIDKAGLGMIRSIFIGTSGGILLFFIIGIQVSICINYFTMQLNGKKVLSQVFNASAIATCLLFFLMLGRVREDLFLLENINGEYQRIGNFLTMFFMILSKIWIITLNMSSEKKLLICKAYVLNSTYFCVFILSLVLSQLIQSNSATALILGIGTCTLFLNYLNFESSSKYSSFAKFFVSRLVYFVFIVFSSTVIIILLLTTFFGINIFDINLFNFGNGGIPSLDSRLKLLSEHGLESTAYAPWFGAYNISEIMTGKDGNHPHSLLLSVMAKLGVFGLVLFLSSFFVTLSQTVQVRKRYDQKLHFVSRFYGLGVLLFVFALGCVTVDLSWSVYWFALGLIGKNLVINESDKKVQFRAN